MTNPVKRVFAFSELLALMLVSELHTPKVYSRKNYRKKNKIE